MSVYKKLNEAREKFHKLELKKSGHNKFAGYHYFELGDFLIPALQVFREVGLCGVVSFEKDEACMTIFDVDKPDSNIVISSPMGSAALKGCHEVQNIGAVETYQRRYLWVTALEIVEHDGLEALTGSDAGAPQPSARQKELDQLADYMLECHESGKDMDAIKVWYDPQTFHQDLAEANEERKYVWGLLNVASKLRAAIKANKPDA